MIIFEGLKENLKFIVLETLSQLESTLAYIKAPNRDDYKSIVDKDNYVDNLKSTIEDLCYRRMGSSAEVTLSKRDTDVVRAVHIIAINLERIADNCINILQQLNHLSKISFIYQFQYEVLFTLLIQGITKIPEVMESRRLNDALDICKIEKETDDHYKRNLDSILEMLEEGGHTRNLVTVLFIFRYLERMGDSLLNVGEALIIGIVGEKIRISQIESLERNLEESGSRKDLNGLTVSSFRGTRSGCRISKVDFEDSPNDYEYKNCILKEGTISKIKAEKESLNTWNQLFPGIAPRVFSYHEKPDSASMLMEFLEGNTLDEIVLDSEMAYMQYVVNAFIDNCNDVWQTTHKPNIKPVDYIAQVKSRLTAVREVHPNFARISQTLGESHIASSDALLDICESVEKDLFAPFTVRIHGDFNVSNIMFDHESDKIRFIDLYRSRDADYLQDASVFLISNFRLPVFSNGLRERLNWVIETFVSFVRSFAEKNNDETFNLRMTLAIARSMYTSTRFELNFKLAKEMYLRAHYLLDKVAKHAVSKKEFKDFKLPDAVLYY